MYPNKCKYQCQQGSCPFAQDPHNSNKYVCRKCGLKLSVNRFEWSKYLLLAVKLIILVFGLFDGQ
ncbi:hypothetical protein DSM106972_092810 [Dulcicalothrix desertica PCC 7102]|uniref:Uncharacterized protein n=1 Tax=Dulcicalothrix desertica PCC 7102 TaxID=232991 RepID=A0A3S1C074_9CYAN|nr:hypothetical protein DSM106972_092810 [Dulcicalothrix desertica PCC 7102]TWH62538.1 hypothetical protein CAL7102_00029 [Dulcicalothrix desertica PCC 7102]